MEEQTVFIVDDDAAVRDSVAELVESVPMTGYVPRLCSRTNILLRNSRLGLSL
jgi:FixJ family two-component response regulator